MAGAFDDHLVGADALHHVVDAVAALVQVAFDLEGREAVGDDANSPSGAVGARAVVAVGDDFGGRVLFMSFAEWAGGRVARRRCLGLEVVRALGPFVGDDHPAADDRVFAEFGHARDLLISDLPHDALEIGRGGDQLEDPLAGSSIEAGFTAAGARRRTGSFRPV